MTLQPMKWAQRLNLNGKISERHANDIEEIIAYALGDAIEMSKDGWIEEGRQQARLKLIQEMQDVLPHYIDRCYPKGTADRGHAIVHIIEFLLDYRDNKV